MGALAKNLLAIEDIFVCFAISSVKPVYRKREDIKVTETGINDHK